MIEQLRIRRDAPGGLWVLEDGRYAVTGPLVRDGLARAVSDWARRRMQRADPDEKAWLQTVIGALAADLPEWRVPRGERQLRWVGVRGVAATGERAMGVGERMRHPKVDEFRPRSAGHSEPTPTQPQLTFAGATAA